MGALMFLPFMFLAVFSVSSTQTSNSNAFNLEENQEPASVLNAKIEASHGRGQKESNRQGGSITLGKPGMLILKGQPGKPGSFHPQGRPAFNQPGMSSALILQGKPVDLNQKGTSSTSSKQEESGSSSQTGKPESPSQQGKPEPSSQQGKPGSPKQQGKPGSSSQKRKSRSFHEEERKTGDNLLKTKRIEIRAGSSSSKNPTINTKCESVYKPVCGSDGKTYGNFCVFKEAKRQSDGKLTLSHEGKC